MSDALPRAAELTAHFRAHLSTVVLGTTSAEGEPDASVAVAILEANGAFVIYISGLAAHTRNLRAVPRASVLLVEPETDSTQPLARRRLTFACTAEPVARESAAHAAFVAQFRTKFGPAIDVVASLPDFQFVRLTPQRGRVVAGFGAAFEVDPRDWSKLTPVGRPPSR
jgi:putative heme iron utilization protein